MTAQDLNTEAGPLRVLQCSRCFSVLSDTSTFLCDSLDEGTISTKAAVNVREDGSLNTHTAGRFKGSSYCGLKCCSCGQLVGRRYVATPPELDLLRTSFTMLLDACEVYNIGSYSVKRRGPDGTETLEEHAPEEPGSSKRRQCDLPARLEKLEAELLRVKGVMVKMSEGLGGSGNPSTPGPRQSPSTALASRKDWMRTALTAAPHGSSPGMPPPSPSAVPRFRAPPPTWPRKEGPRKREDVASAMATAADRRDSCAGGSAAAAGGSQGNHRSHGRTSPWTGNLRLSTPAFSQAGSVAAPPSHTAAGAAAAEEDHLESSFVVGRKQQQQGPTCLWSLAAAPAASGGLGRSPARPGGKAGRQQQQPEWSSAAAPHPGLQSPGAAAAAAAVNQTAQQGRNRGNSKAAAAGGDRKRRRNQDSAGLLESCGGADSAVLPSKQQGPRQRVTRSQSQSHQMSMCP